MTLSILHQHPAVLKHTIIPFILALICLASVPVYAQYDTIKTFYPSGSIESLVPVYNKAPEGTARYFYENGTIKEEREYVAGKIEGTIKLYRPGGKLLEVFTIENGKREGAVTRYDEKGDFVDEQYFSNGLVQPPPPVDTSDISTVAHAEIQNGPPPQVTDEKKPTINQAGPEAKSVASKPFTVNLNDTLVLDLTSSGNEVLKKFDQIPAPAQGMSYFREKLNYSAYAKKNKIQGVVIVKAMVNVNGDVMSAEVIKGIGGGCDESAEIAVNYTKFKPAVFKGTALNTYILFPVEFKLSEAEPGAK